mmetsp:Transcript_16520/g.64493  ORF Transcript_16520/g.64493 Transcript_16520/m.64493 type:complete len:247 (-) Transcript_16520:1162-1902(-)
MTPGHLEQGHASSPPSTNATSSALAMCARSSLHTKCTPVTAPVHSRPSARVRAPHGLRMRQLRHTCARWPRALPLHNSARRSHARVLYPLQQPQLPQQCAPTAWSFALPACSQWYLFSTHATFLTPTGSLLQRGRSHRRTSWRLPPLRSPRSRRPRNPRSRGLAPAWARPVARPAAPTAALALGRGCWRAAAAPPPHALAHSLSCAQRALLGLELPLRHCLRCLLSLWQWAVPGLRTLHALLCKVE